MTAVRVTILCLSAAMISALVRCKRPEIAAGISLAVGLGALLMTQEIFGDVFDRLFGIIGAMDGGDELSGTVIKAAGITILSELGVQICADLGESALAGRIRLAVRIVLLGMAAPMAAEIIDTVSMLL